MSSHSSPLNGGHTDSPPHWSRKVLDMLFVAGLVYLIILGVGMVGSGFKEASGGKAWAEGFLGSFSSNPVLALFVAMFATALVQSSSTVTGVIVGLVATEGGLPVEDAIPMIMGANIGTTVTNTIVSLTHITRPQEFRRAFAAATVHDIFNLIAVFLFLPIELMTGFLRKSAIFLTHTFAGDYEKGEKMANPIKAITKPVIKWIQQTLDNINGEEANVFGGVTLSILGVCILFFSILVLGKILRRCLQGRAERVFHAAVGRGPLSGIASGTIITIMVQSSSTTTSLIIPMAGSGILKLKNVFPFTLGANIGTTVTALMIAFSGASAKTATAYEFGIQIALIHLLFNIFGVVIIYGIPFLRQIPLSGAEKLADLALKQKALAIAYILAIFFGLPMLIIGIMELFADEEIHPSTTPTAIEQPLTPAEATPATQLAPAIQQETK